MHEGCEMRYPLDYRLECSCLTSQPNNSVLCQVYQWFWRYSAQREFLSMSASTPLSLYVAISVRGLLALDSKTGTLSRTTALLKPRLILVGGVIAKKQRGRWLMVQVEWCHTEEGPQLTVMRYVMHVPYMIACTINSQLSCICCTNCNNAITMGSYQQKQASIKNPPSLSCRDNYNELRPRSCALMPSSLVPKYIILFACFSIVVGLWVQHIHTWSFIFISEHVDEFIHQNYIACRCGILCALLMTCMQVKQRHNSAGPSGVEARRTKVEKI